jgi:hypothetical protein
MAGWNDKTGHGGSSTRIRAARQARGVDRYVLTPAKARSDALQAAGGRNGGAVIMAARREHPGRTHSRSADGAREAATTGGSTAAAQALTQPQAWQLPAA